VKVAPKEEKPFKLKRPFKKRIQTPPLEEVASAVIKAPAPLHTPRVLNSRIHDPAKQVPLKELIIRIVAFAQVLMEKRYYPYQTQLAYRIVESLLLHDGDAITSLMSRQAGKTETIGGTVAACAIMLPILANQYPDDWRLNITDDQGNYRGFRHGIKTGIYAPKHEQSQITFQRVRGAIETKSAAKALKELGVRAETNNGNTVSLSNGSEIICQSASELSKIEGATHHLLIAEEAQDISDLKMRKSLHPMTASTKGTIVKIGTASTQKCDFYNAIQENRRIELLTGKRNHFFFPWTVCSRYNSLYLDYIEKEKTRIGEDSDEFRMSYCGEWIFERGMFITQDILFNREVAQREGLWSDYHWTDRPGKLKYYDIVVGIDWGQTSDSTVLCVMAVDWKSPLDSFESSDSSGRHSFISYRKHVLGWLEFVGDTYETQYHEIYERLKGMPNLRKIIMDSNTCGKPMYDRFSAVFASLHAGVQVEEFNFSPKLKSDGYKALSSDLVAKRITFPAGPNARDRDYKKFVFEMLDLKKEYKGGLMCVAHPDERGAHDDYPDAFMLAAWGCNQPSTSGIVELGGSNPFLS
jgi:hypothetical protein